MEKTVIRNLQDRVIVLIMLIVAFALTGTSSFGSTFHGYLQNGVMEYQFYATPLTYLLMYLSFVFLALVVFVLAVFLRDLKKAKAEGVL